MQRKMNRPADYIIIRFVEGNASEDELREVSSWVEESEANTVRDDSFMPTTKEGTKDCR